MRRNNLSKLKHIIKETIHNVNAKRRNKFLAKLDEALMTEMVIGGACIENIDLQPDGSGDASFCKIGCFFGCGSCDCIKEARPVASGGRGKGDFMSMSENKNGFATAALALREGHSFWANKPVVKATFSRLNERETADLAGKPGASYEDLIAEIDKYIHKQNNGGCKDLSTVIAEQTMRGRGMKPGDTRKSWSMCLDTGSVKKDGDQLSWGPNTGCGTCPGCGDCTCVTVG